MDRCVSRQREMVEGGRVAWISAWFMSRQERHKRAGCYSKLAAVRDRDEAWSDEQFRAEVVRLGKQG